MPTLHNVTEKTKKVLKILTIITITIVSIYLLFRLVLFLKETFFPTPPDPPTVTFGKIDVPTFPESESAGLNYEIDTVTGTLPVLLDENKKPLDRVNVYKIHNPEFSLLDLQNAKATVAKVGFLGKENPTPNENVYLWTSSIGGLSKQIFMNIVSKNFDLGSNFRGSPEILARVNMPDTPAAIEAAQGFLNTMGLFPKDIDPSKSRTELLKINGTQLIPVETLREAQIIRVNFFQKDIDKMKIFYVNPPFSSLNFYVAGGERYQGEIVEGNFHHQLITGEKATYPIKPVEIAFEELKEGNAYIATNFTQKNPIKIKEVFLAYYASDEFQEYLVPIYVFKGKGDEFYAYVLAIPNEWLGANE